MSQGWGFSLPGLSRGEGFVHNDCPGGRVFASSRVSGGGGGGLKLIPALRRFPYMLRSLQTHFNSSKRT